MKAYKEVLQVVKNEETPAEHILKRLHDESLRGFSTLYNYTLITNKLNNQQIWQQINSHMGQMIPKWNKYLDKISRQLVREEEQMQEEEEYVPDAMEEEEYEPEEEPYYNEDASYAMDVYEDMVGIEDEDVGLYGEQLDDVYEDEYSYGNILDQDYEEPQHDEEYLENDNIYDDNFEHFREIELENQDAEPDEPYDKISKLENRLLDRSDWRLKGEVQSKDRPLNSLIDNELQFKRAIKPQQYPTEYFNSEIENIIKQRVLDQLFDDRVRFEVAPGFKYHFTALPSVSVDKNDKGLGYLYEEEFKNAMGLKETKEQKLKSYIMGLFKELNYKLDCLTNFSFIPKPVIKEAKITSEPYIIKEEKIPITIAKDSQATPYNLKRQLKSEKELTSQDRNASRLKNKRIAKQRKKERDAKKANRSIEYGGLTKFEAEARKKILKNKQSAKKVKYSQSGQFFKKLQENTSSKGASRPNANMNKLKM